MNKVLFIAPNENWIVDAFKKQWEEGNPDISISLHEENGKIFFDDKPDVIWLNASWCWKNYKKMLDFCISTFDSKIITTIHHIVPEKFSKQEIDDFKQRDEITTVYHVYNQRVLDFIRPLTDKPIFMLPYWADQRWFAPVQQSKQQLRDKHGLSQDVFLVGSFQRDTESASINDGSFLPKREKGPDLFCDAVEALKNTTHPNIHVLLTAWRRQYIIKRLIAAKIPYSYFEMPKHQDLCELYQCLDLYIMASRVEGGPASLIECGLMRVPVISTPCGIAEQVLSRSAININVVKAIPEVPNVEHMKLPNGFKPYRDLINSL